MKKLKKILGCVATGALSLILAITSAGVKTANANSTVIDKEYVENLFQVTNGGIIEAGYYMPKYVTDRGYWNSQSNGVKITFTQAGETNPIVYQKALNLEQVKQLVSFTALPNENVYKTSKVEFNNLYVTIYEFDKTNNERTGKEVTFVYNSGYRNPASMVSAEEGGEVSSYFSAFAKNGASQQETQSPYCLVNNVPYLNGDGTKTTSVIVNESILGSPRYNSAGAGGSTSVQASMRDTTEPLTFGYTQTGSKETGDLLCLGTASAKTSIRYGHNIRVFNEYRNPYDVHDENTVKNTGYVDDSYINGDGETVGKIFEGFSEDSGFKVKFHIDAFYGSSTEASFMIFQIGGESLQNRLEATTNYYGIKNVAYPIPAPTFTNESGNVLNASAFDYNVKIEGPEFTAEGNKLSTFTPTSAGEYAVRYTTTEGSKTYGLTLNVTVVESVPDVSIENVTSVSEFNNLYGSDYLVSAKAISKIYFDDGAPTLTAELFKKEGGSLVSKGQVAIGEKLNLKTLNLGFGEYVVRYTAKDVLNRQTVKEIALNQTEANRLLASMLNGIENESENYYVGSNSDVLISPSDVTIFDGVLGRDFVAPSIYIYYESETTPYEVINSVYFGNYLATRSGDKWGTYRISYVYEIDYGGGNVVTKTLNKYLEVLDAISPKIYSVTDRCIFGAKLDADKSAKYVGVKYFTAKKGANLEFDAIVAGDDVGEISALTNRISLTVIKPDKSSVIYESKEKATDPAQAFNSLDFNYLVDTNGQYVFRFDVYDEMGGVTNLTSSLVYIVDVANDFYTVNVSKEYDIDNNFDSFELSAVTVTNFDGNLVSADVTVSAINTMGETVWTGVPGDVKKFDVADTYDIVVTAKIGGVVVAEDKYEVTILDTSKPQIIIKGELVSKGVVGKEIRLADVSTTDENGYSAVSVEIRKDKQLINVYQNAFTPIESGSYTVTYTALDLAGNVNEYVYTIIVVDDYDGSLAVFFNNYGLLVAIPLVLVAVALIVLLKLTKGKKATTNDEEIETVEDETVEVEAETETNLEEVSNENK